ncbi:MAG: KpsF/GutQ family sugar-phosphate isomerase [Myxococcales bacterium]|nr:KpsF/GutQ family sugar-phosphate isomerase [Myxococcales bacterium]
MARSPRSLATRAPALRVVRQDVRPARTRRRVRGREASRLVAYARGVLEAEASAIRSLRSRLSESFLAALELLLSCAGHVVLTGMGKPGFIAQKLSATLASTGVPSFYLHPAEAGHGDLGRVSRGDVVVALSNSGSTEEIVRLIPWLRRIGARIIAITGDPASPLARSADVVLDIGRIDEACPMGLVPTASSAAMHAMGDALAMTLVKRRHLTSDDYALLHPGGKLGRAARRVFEVMRAGEANPVVREGAPLAEVVVVMTKTPGRPGAANVVDRSGKLVGIFTDGDLRRLVERGSIDFAAPVREVMGRQPRVVKADDLVLSAAAKMREHKVDQLPVVDEDGRPVGLLDVQDLLAARFV